MEYSAGFTKESLFEQELEHVLKLKKQELSKQEIFQKISEENIFQLRSLDSVKTRFNMVYRRSEVFDEVLSNIYMNGSTFDRKALILFSFMKVYRITYEFFVEVMVANYHEKKATFDRADFHYFFEKKALQSDKVKEWRPETLKKLTSVMLKFFQQCGLIIKKEKNTYTFAPLHISSQLREYAENNNKQLSLLAKFK